MDKKCERMRLRFPSLYQRGLALRSLAVILVAAIIVSTADTAPSFESSRSDTVVNVIAEADHCIDAVKGACLDPVLRGGSSLQHAAEETVEKYLAEDRTAASKEKFHVQGWRWHTLSLVRDARRLETLALRQLTAGAPEGVEIARLDKAAKHVVDFNMAGLHRIENELFFPWMREKLCAGNAEEHVRDAFREILDSIDEDRRHVAKLGEAVREQAKIASSAHVSSDRRAEATSNVARMAAALNTRAQSVMDREERLLVPAVAVSVPEKEQKSFNSRVIRKLGILDSRLHLVGMHDAVWEGGDERERELFNEAIPALPRMMIPRWRKNLYEASAGDLD